MKLSAQKLFCMSLCVFMLAAAGSAYGETGSDGLIPAGMKINEGFKPGIGTAVGEITQVSGKAAVIHANEPEGYWVKEGDKLFKGDILVTLADANMAFKLDDGSFVTLSPETKLEITKSVYAPEKKTRSTFIDMIAGKTRFIVKKLVDARHSEFKVKTTTSVAGVRGSDFIISTTESATEVTTLQDTELEIISLAAPDVKPTILKDFERTAIKKGALPEEVRKVSAEEVDRMMKEFKFKPSESKPGAAATTEKGEAQLEKQPLPENEVTVLKQDDLIKPEPIRQDITGRTPLVDPIQSNRAIQQQKQVEDTKTSIIQQQTEKIQRSDLPEFPGTP